jgi:hypothetical protein
VPIVKDDNLPNLLHAPSEPNFKKRKKKIKQLRTNALFVGHVLFGIYPCECKHLGSTSLIC